MFQRFNQWLASCGIERRAGLVLDENLVATKEQPPVLQRLDQVKGERVPARRERADCAVGIVEAVLGETRKRRFVALRACAERPGEEQAESDYDRDDAFARQHFRLFPIPALRTEAAGFPPPPSLAEQPAERQLPHLLVLVFQLPHLWVTQSPTRSFEPSSSLDHASPGTRPSVFHTTSNWPSPRTSPMNTGLVM